MGAAGEDMVGTEMPGCAAKAGIQQKQLLKEMSKYTVHSFSRLQ